MICVAFGGRVQGSLDWSGREPLAGGGALEKSLTMLRAWCEYALMTCETWKLDVMNSKPTVMSLQRHLRLHKRLITRLSEDKLVLSPQPWTNKRSF